MKLRSIPGAGSCRIGRGPEGVAHIVAADMCEAQVGLGYCHARDRGLQLLLTRILGRGQTCEKLQDNPEMFELDAFFRRWNLYGDAEREEAALSTRARAMLEAYCRGVNLYFGQGRVPWELRLLGYRFEPWIFADSFLMGKLAGLIGLAQSQAEMERFLVECVQNGVERAKLEELFPGLLEGLDEELLRRVRLERRLVPSALKWASALPRMVASNNWALSGPLTASGRPIFCNDPHLEINRLPAVWYEAVLSWDKPESRYAIGGTFPGAPGVVFGRTPDLAWGVTYAFMDCIDSWIEDCREGKYRRGEQWVAFPERKEMVHRKKGRAVELSFFENNHGVLEGNPHEAGLYLATRWSGAEGTSASALDSACGVLTARTVQEGRDLLGTLSNGAWNWVLADTSGGIAYQMSGLMPLRRAGVSGVVPLPGWDTANDWNGFQPPENLPRALNPPEGFLATANEDLNALGKARPSNLPMASYRADRISSVLREARGVTVDQMKALQFDLYSRQAEAFLKLIRPLLPAFRGTHLETCRLLENWDLRYTSTSKGAFVFERVYRALLQEVFCEGRGCLGKAVMSHVLDETCLVNDFCGNFDRILLSAKSAWFGGRSREEIYQAALASALAAEPRPYGTTRRIRMRHLLFGGKLPVWLGFDPEIELRGSGATIHQGQIFRSGGRATTFGPSLRLITDLGTDEVHTTLPGGPSDRRFSPWYASSLQNWVKGKYKVLATELEAPWQRAKRCPGQVGSQAGAAPGMGANYQEQAPRKPNCTRAAAAVTSVGKASSKQPLPNSSI